MPAKSKAQQKAAGAALSVKRGETSKSKLKGASRSMVTSMSEDQLEEMASTERKKLPERKGSAKRARGASAAKKSPSKKSPSKKTSSKTSAKKAGSRKTKSAGS